MSVRKRQWTTRKGEKKEAWIVDYVDRCGIRRKADRIPTEGGQHSDDCGQPVIAA
jgi:hypothetical protein